MNLWASKICVGLLVGVQACNINRKEIERWAKGRRERGEYTAICISPSRDWTRSFKTSLNHKEKDMSKTFRQSDFCGRHDVMWSHFRIRGFFVSETPSQSEESRLKISSRWLTCSYTNQHTQWHGFTNHLRRWLHWRPSRPCLVRCANNNTGCGKVS